MFLFFSAIVTNTHETILVSKWRGIILGMVGYIWFLGVKYLLMLLDEISELYEA